MDRDGQSQWTSQNRVCSPNRDPDCVEQTENEAGCMPHGTYMYGGASYVYVYNIFIYIYILMTEPAAGATISYLLLSTSDNIPKKEDDGRDMI